MPGYTTILAITEYWLKFSTKSKEDQHGGIILLQKWFSPNNRISVKFVDNEGKSKGAVNVGGPKREVSSLDGQDVALCTQRQ